MFKQPRAVSRLGLALALIATLVFAVTTPQSATGSSDTGNTTAITDAASTFDPVQLPLSFVENVGQVESSDIIFQANGLGASLFFSQNDVILMLPGSDNPYVVNLDFVGANTNVNIAGASQLPGVVNYYLGNNPDEWLTDIPTYEGINYQNLYPGVDLNYVGTQGILKSTYSVAAGANASIIAWRYASALDARIDAETGDLHIVLDDVPGSGEVILVERAPVAWQTIAGERVPVDVRYAIDDTQTVSFEVGDYDPAYALTLDPELLYSSYFGGINTDIAYAVTSDTKGNVYIAGQTKSFNLPAAPMNGTNIIQGNYDAFVTKVNVAISSQQVVYSSYLGGALDDYGYDIALDQLNNAYVTGQTKSFDFPSYPPDPGGAYPNKQGASDAFVVKFNASGTALLYSTFLGGTGDESGNAIDVDSSGNAYVTGWTTSSAGFPLASAFDPTFNFGGRDAFVTKLNSNGSGLLYSTYLGGSGYDVGNGIEVFSVGGKNYAVVVGQAGTGFPVANAEDPSLGGSSDAFLTRFEANGQSLVYSTYLGGNGLEEATDLAVDPVGNVYLTGWTTTANTSFRVTPDAKQSSLAGAEDAFVAKFDSTGSDLLYLTYFGGAGLDKAYAIDLDIEGIIHFAGETHSNETTFPLVGAFTDRDPEPPNWDQLTLEVAPDGFVAGFDPTDPTPGNYLYSSYLGGMGSDAADIAWDLVVDVSGGVNVVGETTSDDFPQVRDSFQRGGGTDAFIAFMSSAKADLIIAKNGPQYVAPGAPMTYVIEVGNLGPNDAYNVQIQDALPTSYVTYISATPSLGTCSESGGKVTCDIDKVRAPSFGDQYPDPVTVAIQVLVNPGVTGSFKNRVEITQSNTFDPNPWLKLDVVPPPENPNAAEHIAFAVPDLVVELTSTNYRISPNPPDSFTYVITVRNDSLVPATNVVVTGIEVPPDVEPSSVAYRPDSGTTFNPATGTWTIGLLEKGDGTYTMEIDATVITDTRFGTFLPLTATASASEDDANMANNTDIVRVKVVSPYGDSGCHPAPDDPDNEVICLSD